MKIRLRTRWSIPIILGMLFLFFVLKLTVNAESILNPYLISLFALFIISLVRFFGTRLIICDEFVEYQHWMLKKKRVFAEDIEDVKILKGKISQFLIITTPDLNIKIFPFFSITLVSILSLITGRPYKFEESQIKLNQQLKKKRIIDIILVGTLSFVFLSLFTYKVAIMNQPEIILVRITPEPQFPLEVELEDAYSLYMTENRIWSSQDAADAALYALKPELSLFSKIFENTYLVFFNYTEQYYVIYRIGLPSEQSYVLFIHKGEKEVYYLAYGER